MKNSSTVFVIGATGYIGSSLFECAKKDFRVYGTSSSGKKDLLQLSFEAPSDFDWEKIHSGDIVFLSAAISAPDVCASKYDLAWSVNVNGTSMFIQGVMERGARVIFFSSDAVYGEHKDKFDESGVCNPAGEYAEMKREVEQRFLGNSLFKSIRLSYVFSREDKLSRYLIGCVERNEEADLFHPFLRAIVHRDDVVKGALALAEFWDKVPEQVINFGGPQVLSRIDFAECLRDAHLHALRFKVSEPDAYFFKNRPRVIAMSSPVFSRLLGRSPSSLREAVRLEFALTSNNERFL